MYESSSRGLVLLGTTDKHNYTITSLLSKTTYTFTVKPYRQGGEGPGRSIEITTSGGKLFCCVERVEW